MAIQSDSKSSAAKTEIKIKIDQQQLDKLRAQAKKRGLSLDDHLAQVINKGAQAFQVYWEKI
jgi:hypothetical protein